MNDSVPAGEPKTDREAVRPICPICERADCNCGDISALIAQPEEAQPSLGDCINGTFDCPLCGTGYPHDHTGEEIAIYNGARSPDLEIKALKAAIGAVGSLANHYIDKGLDGRKEYPLYGVVLRSIKNRLELEANLPPVTREPHTCTYDSDVLPMQYGENLPPGVERINSLFCKCGRVNHYGTVVSSTPRGVELPPLDAQSDEFKKRGAYLRDLFAKAELPRTAFFLESALDQRGSELLAALSELQSLREQLAVAQQWKSLSVTAVAAENPSVAEYVEQLESQLRDAQAKMGEAEQLLNKVYMSTVSSYVSPGGDISSPYVRVTMTTELFKQIEAIALLTPNQQPKES